MEEEEKQVCIKKTSNYSREMKKRYIQLCCVFEARAVEAGVFQVCFRAVEAGVFQGSGHRYVSGQWRQCESMHRLPKKGNLCRFARTVAVKDRFSVHVCMCVCK